MKKAIITALLAIALPLVSQAQRQTFNLPAYFATNVFLSDNTNTPLHNRIQAIEQTNTDVWATFPATTNLNLDGFGASNVNDIAFDLAPSGSVAVGRMQWDANIETLRLGLDSAVSLDVGQQQVALVRNAESVTISNGTVVYISGATGDKASVKIASYSNDTLSARTIGIAAEDITAGSLGFVVTRGPVYAQNTAAFTAGAMLYLGANGNVTTNRPQAPLHGVFIGVVEKVNANAGIIYVAVQNGFELDELHDVNVSATSNTLIRFDGTVWTNISIGSGLGVTSNQLVVTNVGGITTNDVLALAITNISDSAFLSRTNPYVSGYYTGGISYIQSLENASFVAGSITTNIITESSRKYWFLPKTKGVLTPVGLYFNPEVQDFQYFKKSNSTTQTLYSTENFSASQFLTVSAGNTNYARRTTVPASNTAFGAYNQWALDNTNLYFYNAASSKWLKVNGTLEW